MKPSLLIVLVATLFACERSQFKETIKNLPEGGTFTDPKTGMTFTMHRKGAGAPDSTGWYPATSLRPCGFHVNMPGPYNDFSQTVRATDGAMINMHVVGTRTVEGAKFTATCTERSDDKISRDFADDVVNGLRTDNPDLHQRKVLFAGTDGVEYSMSSSQTAAIGRLAVIGTRAYQLIVEYPRSEDQYMPDVANSFFQSFEPL